MSSIGTPMKATGSVARTPYRRPWTSLAAPAAAINPMTAPAIARRMTEVAAHITDHVLPQLPVGQWVLSLPKRLRPFLIWAVEFPIRLSVRRITQRDLRDSEDSHFLLEAEQPRDLQRERTVAQPGAAEWGVALVRPHQEQVAAGSELPTES